MRGYGEVIRLLAKQTDMSERAARRAVRELEAKGVVTLLGSGGFQINIDVLDAMPRVGDDEQ